MSKIVLLFVCMALAHVASALQCYTCIKAECDQEMSKWGKTPDCGKSAVGGHTGACLKQVFTDKITKKEMTNRKCVLAEKTKTGAEFKCSNDDGETSTCDVCITDFCNSAPRLNFGFVAILGVVAAYLIPKVF